MIAKVLSVLMDEHHFSDEFTFGFRKRLLPYDSGGIWTLENGNWMTISEKTFLSLILLTHFS